MPDGQSNVDATLLKLAEQYQALNVRSRSINDERANIRENVDKLGVSPKAFQVALIMARDLNKGERADYQDSLNRVLGVLDGKEADLFGAAEIAARDKRAQKRADKAAGKPTGKAKADAKSDSSPRSDPEAGGAGKRRGRPPNKDKPASNVVPLREGASTKEIDESIKQTAAELNAEQEQREGAAILDRSGSAPVDNGGKTAGESSEPISQSAQAQAQREKAGLN